jgi:hypothetical protein
LGNCVFLFGTAFYTFCSIITINICGLCLWRLHVFVCLNCNFGHRIYYLIDNQANLIVICPLNVINKHRWSTEYCHQKHEIIFTNQSFLCQGQLYRQNRSMLSKNWRSISFYHSYSYISFHLQQKDVYFRLLNVSMWKSERYFKCVRWAFPTTKIIEYSVQIILLNFTTFRRIY